MQCQSCGDTQGPWVFVDGIGVLCEDCYAYKEVCDKMVTLIKHHKCTKGRSIMDIIAFVDGIESRVYDELMLR